MKTKFEVEISPSVNKELLYIKLDDKSIGSVKTRGEDSLGMAQYLGRELVTRVRRTFNQAHQVQCPSACGQKCSHARPHTKHESCARNDVCPECEYISAATCPRLEECGVKVRNGSGNCIHWNGECLHYWGDKKVAERSAAEECPDKDTCSRFARPYDEDTCVHWEEGKCMLKPPCPPRTTCELAREYTCTLEAPAIPPQSTIKTSGTVNVTVEWKMIDKNTVEVKLDGQVGTLTRTSSSLWSPVGTGILKRIRKDAF